MRRRLIKQGHDTLTITLPKSWITRQKLNKGDEIIITESGGNLILTSDNKTDGVKRIVIDVTNLTNPLIWKYFMAVYRAGYDEIKFVFPHSKKLYEVTLSSTRILEKKTNQIGSPIKLSIIEILQDMAHRFIGMEIIEQKETYCVVRDVSEPSEKEFENSIRRIFTLLLGMAEDNIELLKKRDDKMRSNIDVSDINIDRFTDYCLRILNKNYYKKAGSDTTSFYSIILLLEFIGDEYRKIAFHGSSLKKTNKLLIELSKKTLELLELFYDFFYKFDDKKAIQIHQKERKLHDELSRADLKLTKEEQEVNFHLKKIKRFIIDLILLRIEQEVSKPPHVSL
ncbi:MAG: hypothetical protein QXP53_00210 [Candidatus Pacearchaeota archaeon]